MGDEIAGGMSRARRDLGPAGRLAELLPGYEPRESQQRMAEAVERALDEDRILLCEAGTGTGKTLAYLLPALRDGRRVVIATGSRALQEQLYRHDLPLAQRALDQPVPTCLTKGLGNYLCRRRFDEAWTGEVDAEGRRSLRLVEAWMKTTDDGDRAGLTSLPEDHPVWARVTSSSDTRVGSRCRFFESCFVTQLKERAQRAQVIVVNHHLLLADLALRGDHPGSVLPDYDALIVDEAHKLEEVATLFFGHRLSSRSLVRLGRDLRRGMRDVGIGSLGGLLDDVEEAAARWFAAINVALGPQDRVPIGPEAWSPSLLAPYHRLDDLLGGVEGELRTAAPVETSAAADRVQQVRASLAAIVEPPRGSLVWATRDQGRLALSASPIEVGPILRERLFDRGLPVVLTSASLTAVDGSFGFVRRRLGLDEPVRGPIDELVVPSPFDHRQQALLYLPRDLPPVDADRFAAVAAERIVALRHLAPGGAFVLCTSKRSLHALATALEAAGLAPMRQGSAPKHALLSRFREDGDAVLVATMSFWEGVDVPGDALSLVVIDRLPFPVPTDPLVVARGEALRAGGGHPFRDDSLPRCALVLKQGYGRLLRSGHDRGVVAVLDRRLLERSYGPTLIESLPPARVTSAWEDVEAFFGAFEEPPDDMPASDASEEVEGDADGGGPP